MKRIMRAFRLDEISAVDRPAQAHAKAVIMKRDDMPDLSKFLADQTVAKDMYGVSNFAQLIQSINYLAQSAERESEMEGDASPVPAALRSWLKDGTTVFRQMADEEVRELITAVNDFGKRDFSAKERRADAKSGAAMPDGSFPIADAEDLANAMRLAGHAKDPAAARRHIKARAKALGLESHLRGAYAKTVIDQADRALAKAIEGGADATAAKDHRDYLDGVLPAEIVKAHRAASSGSTAQGDAMSIDIEKAKGLKEKQKAYYADLSEQEKEDFLAMSEGERDKAVAKDPDDKDQGKTDPKGDKADKRADDLAKRLDDAVAKAAAQDAIIKAMQEERDVAAFGKRAVGLGLDEKRGETLRKAYQGDKAAITDLETMIKGLVESARVGKVFAEFGSIGSGAPATAKAEMDALVADVAKRDGLTAAKAFTKVYTDPAHAALKARYDAETSPLAKRRG